MSATNKEIGAEPSMPEVVEAKGAATELEMRDAAGLDEKSGVAAYRAGAIEAENAEHNMTVLEAVRAYPMAAFWAFVMSFTIIMESYDVFLCNSFVALGAFKQNFGIESSPGVFVIEPQWQSALQVSGQLGALIGVFVAGPLTSAIGYRWATITGLMLLNAFIFIFFFAQTMPVIFAAQIMEGIPWGIFIANAPAYCSEIVPIQLRAPATQMLQMFWAIGSIIVGAVCYCYQGVEGSTAWKVPIALQWMFPTPLAILMFIAPESPWWLVRKGRLDDAAKAVARLGSKGAANVSETVSMMRRVVELEETEKSPSYIELFQGTNTYRTLIVCGVYAAQNLTGNLIANQAVYFFQQAGMGDQLAFAMGLITSALQMIFVMLSWILTTYLGRRDIYVWGSLINTIFLIALGIAGSVTQSTAQTNAVAALGLIISVGFTLGPAPASWVIIGETSAIRLRPLTTGIGRAAYYIVEIPCIFLASYMLNPTGGALGGKCGYVWGATGLICFILAFFFLPEMKNRSYREIDIMFNRHIPARKWKEQVIDPNDDE